MTPYRDEHQAMSVAFYVAGKARCRGPGYVAMIGGAAGVRGWMSDVSWDHRMALATLTLKLVRTRVNHDAWMVLMLRFAVDVDERHVAGGYVTRALHEEHSGRYPMEFVEAVTVNWAQPCKLTAIDIAAWERRTGLSERTLRYWSKTLRTSLKLRLWQALSDAAQALIDEGLIDG